MWIWTGGRMMVSGLGRRLHIRERVRGHGE